MNVVKKMLMMLVVILSTGCATGLNSIQLQEYKSFELDGVLVEEKDPSVGAALGLLPGGGSFYAREPGYGLLNLLLWPFSILWDPLSGLYGSQKINYTVTKYALNQKKEKELSALEEKLGLGEMEYKEYILAKNKVEAKYSYE